MLKAKRFVRIILTAGIAAFLFSGIGFAAEQGGKVNINTATAKELQKISGIGKTLAERIVTYRTESGPFKTLDEITKVKGVGKSTFEKIKDQISVGAEVAKATSE